MRNWSACPWIVTSSAATEASTERGTLRPDSMLRDRPEAGTLRDRNSSPSSGSKPASRAAATAAGDEATSNTPCAHAS